MKCSIMRRLQRGHLCVGHEPVTSMAAMFLGTTSFAEHLCVGHELRDGHGQYVSRSVSVQRGHLCGPADGHVGHVSYGDIVQRGICVGHDSVTA